MKRNNTLCAGVGLWFLCIFLSGCTPVPETLIQPKATATLIISDALRQDAEAMASNLGLSVDEAIRRLSLQDSIGGLGAQLEQQEADTFAGLWIQHEPEYRVIESYLIIWQPGYFLNDNSGQIEILDRDGRVVARVGEKIRLGGGEVSLTGFNSQLQEPIPSQCQGPYWLMGEIVAGN